MRILLLNAGSSSLKCSLMETEQRTAVAQAMADWAGSDTRYQYRGPDGTAQTALVPWKGHADAVRRFAADISASQPVALRDHASLAAVGHRIVHGGDFTSSVRITPNVRGRIAALAQSAPLHNRPSLEALGAAEAEFPQVPQFAVFDTAFHATLPPEAYTYPVPHHWTHDWGIRRFGFHGLSHAYCATRAAEMLRRPSSELRLVICHLGHGCSAAAVEGGRCLETTMGFTPLEGLMMGTRSGSIDPGIILHVQQQHGLSAEQVDTALNRESGLLAVSGIAADMREVLAAWSQGNRRAHLAVAIYTRRIRQAVGALVVTMGGLDALVFTAGVGEHSGEIRQLVCDGLQCLGIELDAKSNAQGRADVDIATASSRVRVLVIAAREDLTMLEEVQQALHSETLIKEPTS
ncbi:MAG: acetate/propionate family kinase [Planctomycetaceae bacterium]